MRRQINRIYFYSILLSLSAASCARHKEASTAPTEESRAASPAGVAQEKSATGLRYAENDLLKSKAADHADSIAFGPVFKPPAVAERKLEYSANLNYQINDLKAARAFFNQWIPRYGFLLSETASGQGNGYLALQVKVRSSQLYAALSELDAIGTLTSEHITVTDHTENAVYRQMQAAREEIRLRRRSNAAQQTGTGSRNWQAAETLLAASEDKELETRMDEWRINDRVSWATISVNLSMLVVTRTANIDVPHFRNAFIGVLNVLLQLLYLAIYVVPIGIIAWLVWRASLKIVAALRKTATPRA